MTTQHLPEHTAPQAQPPAVTTALEVLTDAVISALEVLTDAVLDQITAGGNTGALGRLR